MNDLIDRIRPLVKLMASERTRSCPHLFDDALQEGLIAAWGAQEKNPGRSDAYYYVAARNRILDIVRGQPMTGSSSRRGWQDAHSGSEQMPDEYDHPQVEDALDFDGVHRAVRSLDPSDREIVFRRYWMGEKDEEIGEQLGLKMGTISYRWSRKIKPSLREALAES